LQRFDQDVGFLDGFFQRGAPRREGFLIRFPNAPRSAVRPARETDFSSDFA
jgi:hypothetical protein